MKSCFVLAALSPLCVLGCGGGEPAAGTTAGSTSAASSGGSTGGGGSGLAGTPIEAEAQREGDPAAGYTALLNEGYVSCGIPWSAYSQVYGPAPASEQLPGRTGKNAELPYYFSAFTTASGVEVVSPNCLVCHAARIHGEIVVGLGAHDGDFTTDPSQTAEAVGFLLSDPTEKDEWRKWADRVKAIAPYIQATTLGANPADNLAAALFAHRDRETLAWSDAPLMALPPESVVPVDVPPWWRMAKKNAMFYVGAGRGDHARIMMTASTLCTDSVAEAQAIDAYFPDVRAYIASIPPPAFPGAVDAALAETGRAVFEATCSKCHGTYGDGGAYPNLLIALDEVATDPLLASGSTQFATHVVDWFNGSFYGEIARLEPQEGYVAPPLDGVWASAPYLHNGSVPTIAALLESSKRPQFWTRAWDDSSAYDDAALGWVHTALETGQDAAPDALQRKKIYDTTKPGYGNQGHTYGDALPAEERAAVIEYLKTL